MAKAPKSGKPNILVIWGDDIGISNLSCYSHGLMGYQTPNIDRLAKEGMMFTNSYGEQSCTAGRSSFITGQSVLRTGLSKVGIPAAPIGMSEKIVTIAGALKNQGYATGQFGKNHLGDLNHMLPTNHGFDEFFGNLYHLNAEEEPEMYDYYPEKDFPELIKNIKPRGVIHSWATDKDDPTEMPRWGKVGKQKIEDTGPLNVKRMPTVDDEFIAAAKDFIKRAEAEGKPWFVWLNTTHMHFVTHTKKESLGQAGRWQSPYHDTMIDHDKNVGEMLDFLDELGIADDTFVQYSTDNGPHRNSWPDGGMTPFRCEKNTNWEGAFRIPLIVRWPSKIKPGSISNEIVQHHDWFPTFLTMAGDSGRAREVEEGLPGLRTHLQEPHRWLRPGALPHGQGKGEPAQALHVHQRRRRHPRRALRQLEGLLHGAAHEGNHGRVGGAVRQAAAGQVLQSANGPVRVRGRDVERILQVAALSRLHPVRRDDDRSEVRGNVQGIPDHPEAEHLRHR